MQFLNTEIDPTTLPAAEELELRSISRNYLKILRTEWLITTVILAAIGGAVIFFIDGMRDPVSMVVVIAAFLLIVFFYRLSFEKAFPYRGYAVRERDVVHRAGWIVRTVKICPINRIQNCSIHVGPLERKYGLAALSLFTAGSTGADMKISGLPAEEAESIRKFILTRINAETESD